ncbi:presenilin-2-like [Mucor ambiguus]|uniref:Presenilin-2-like n=1 Tax=Mucor ambiguus TaxID=91626 RepID=A0A0C9MMU3_9FUNG|nr:presenilin-2-like [Mucor ambiguus]
MSKNSSLDEEEEDEGPIQSNQPLLNPTETERIMSPEQLKAEQKRKETIQFYVEQLTLLFYPLIVTFALTCWIEMTLDIDSSQISNPLMVYAELPSDSVGTRLGGSVLNAIIVVCGITLMTFMFVLCFKYRLYKFLFFWLGLSVLSILGVTASALWIEMMNVYNVSMDYFTMFFCTWNVAVVGVVAIFWKSPLWVQQVYLVLVSAATSISMLRMPPWTTWTVLIGVAIYDIFAVLCPAGPLKLLITMAEERQENIPALLYSAGMASFDTDDDFIGGYRTQESNRVSKSHSKWLPFTKTNKGYRPLHNDELDDNPTSSIALSTFEQSRDVERQNSNEAGEHEEEEEEDDEMNAIKLGAYR